MFRRVHRRLLNSRRVITRLEKLEARQLLAGDVCFPVAPSFALSQPIQSHADSAEPVATYGPIRLSSVDSPQVTPQDGVAVPIVSIFPDSSDEGNSLTPTEIASATSITPNMLSFTVSLSQPADSPVSVEVQTSDGTGDGLVVQRIASGFSRAIYATAPASDFDRLFVIEQRSGIRIVNLDTGITNATPFLSPAGLNTTNNEGGLLGLAFHPDYATNGRFFINMTNTSGDTEIREYTVSPTNPDIADAASVKTILTLDQPFGNHNGGWLDFGPDGYLYIALGDGGSGNDPGNRSQNIENLLGKMLRIDIDGDDFPADENKNYAIPASNPFVNVAGADEIWAYGLRNPYRSSFDRETGDLYIGDVGQNRREELNVQPADSAGGENYGWRLREGMIATPTPTANPVGGPKPTGAIDPIYDYTRGIAALQGTSVTGGYVYRGPIDDLHGHYFFGDFVNQRVWGLHFNGDDPSIHGDTNYQGFTDWTDLLSPDVGTINNVASFGEDAAGNLYIVDYAGEVFAIRNGADYVPTTQTINFDVGEESKTFDVPIVYDILQEADETVFASINSVSGATIGNATAVGTIVNDDGSPAVVDVQIDDGTLQRSMITSVTVTLDGLVDVDESSFLLMNLGTTANPSSTEVTGLLVDRRVEGLQTIATITFDSGPSVVDRPAGNSLIDGKYELSLDGSIIADAADDFFRLFGDADGSGSTNFTDFSQSFLPSFATVEGDPAFDHFMDDNGDGIVNFTDFANGFLPNFAMSI
tara:strand:+ start:21481 stop:23754 length:2274 start_codon:yes stop_codon:yes gene_type:complete